MSDSSYARYIRDNNMDPEGETHAADWTEEDQRLQDEQREREARHVDLVEFCRSLLFRPDMER